MYSSYLEPKILLASVSQVWGVLSGPSLRSNSLPHVLSLQSALFQNPGSSLPGSSSGSRGPQPCAHTKPYHRGYLPR